MVSNTAQKKEIFIAAYRSNFFNISKSCKAADVGRSTFYDWKNDDPDFVQELEDARIDQIKWVEERMFNRMEEGSDRLIEFYLKTKGKSEGYAEDRHQIDANVFFKLIIPDEEDDNKTDSNATP